MNKIYPQDIQGKYRTIKNYATIGLLLVYFLGSWIPWSRGVGAPNQAILMDLPNRRAYLFGIEIWPQEIYYITGILIIAALGLFFFTSLFGRLWCGYTCPHTVFTEIFVKIEKFFQGDRNARIRLDASPNSAEKFRKKAATHLCWALVAFSFAFGWICYFYGAKQLTIDLLSFQVSPNATLWLMGLTFSTYLFAGYIRQRVCVYMCPYGRFQSAMLDNDTMIVSYHAWRGEPRGAYNPQDGNLGDCIDCGKCVVVCPMGIDIRNGLQLPCISCGLCIDACNSVMKKLGRPEDLISYESINGEQYLQRGEKVKRNYLNAKTVIFASVFFIVCSTMLYALLHKPTILLYLEKDKGAIFTLTPDGDVRNTYILKIFNQSLKTRVFDISLKYLPNGKFMLQDKSDYVKSFAVTLAPEEELSNKLFIKIPNLDVKVHDISFQIMVEERQSGEIVKKSNVFLK